MAEEKKVERVYNIPLRKVYQKAPPHKRAKKAISAIFEFAARHMKSDDVKIGKFLNLKVWERGIRNPPHHVKVNCIKDEKGVVTVELFDAPKEVKKTDDKKKKAAKKITEAKEEKKETKQETPVPHESKEKVEKAEETQKEEIKELKKEKPKEHKPKTEAKSKPRQPMKKEFVSPKNE